VEPGEETGTAAQCQRRPNGGREPTGQHCRPTWTDRPGIVLRPSRGDDGQIRGSSVDRFGVPYVGGSEIDSSARRSRLDNKDGDGSEPEDPDAMGTCPFSRYEGLAGAGSVISDPGAATVPTATVSLLCACELRRLRQRCITQKVSGCRMS
jgi:hypothetical protein